MTMHEQTDENTVSTTGRGYNRHLTDREHAATGVAADLYAPIPGDDNDTRPGMVERADAPTVPVQTDRSNANIGAPESVSTYQQRADMNPSPTTAAYTMRTQSRRSDSGITRKIQENPLAVVAAATAGGMLLGRMMRKRDHRRDEGYLRSTAGRGFQSYRYPEYPQQSYRPYQGNAGNQMPSGFQDGPQYRAEQEFRPERGFQGRHENFPGGSNWD